jgi:hypothetical protein
VNELQPYVSQSWPLTAAALRAAQRWLAWLAWLAQDLLQALGPCVLPLPAVMQSYNGSHRGRVGILLVPQPSADTAALPWFSAGRWHVTCALSWRQSPEGEPDLPVGRNAGHAHVERARVN